MNEFDEVWARLERLEDKIAELGLAVDGMGHYLDQVADDLVNGITDRLNSLTGDDDF